MSTVRRLNCSSLRFLIVDPDAFYRAILRSVFWGFGAKTILEAGTAEEAIGIFRNHDIDLMTSEWSRLDAPMDASGRARRPAAGAEEVLA